MNEPAISVKFLQGRGEGVRTDYRPARPGSANHHQIQDYSTMPMESVLGLLGHWREGADWSRGERYDGEFDMEFHLPEAVAAEYAVYLKNRIDVIQESRRKRQEAWDAKPLRDKIQTITYLIESLEEYAADADSRMAAYAKANLRKAQRQLAQLEAQWAADPEGAEKEAMEHLRSERARPSAIGLDGYELEVEWLPFNASGFSRAKFARPPGLDIRKLVLVNRTKKSGEHRLAVKLFSFGNHAGETPVINGVPCPLARKALALNRLWLFHLQANVIYEGGEQH